MSHVTGLPKSALSPKKERSAVHIAARTTAFVLAGAAVITLCAKVQVPFWPVPMTLHTLAVLGLAVIAGPRIATAAFIVYLVAGLVGFPVFSGSPQRGIGLAYMAGPTGGYLAGYLAASWITGTLARGWGPDWLGAAGRIGAMLAGLAVIYAAGLAWLALYIPAAQVFALGFAPFILGDLLKVAVVAAGAQAVAVWVVRRRQ